MLALEHSTALLYIVTYELMYCATAAANINNVPTLNTMQFLCGFIADWF